MTERREQSTSAPCRQFGAAPPDAQARHRRWRLLAPRAATRLRSLPLRPQTTSGRTKPSRTTRPPSCTRRRRFCRITRRPDLQYPEPFEVRRVRRTGRLRGTGATSSSAPRRQRTAMLLVPTGTPRRRTATVAHVSGTRAHDARLTLPIRCRAACSKGMGIVPPSDRRRRQSWPSAKTRSSPGNEHALQAGDGRPTARATWDTSGRRPMRGREQPIARQLTRWLHLESARGALRALGPRSGAARASRRRRAFWP